MVLFPDKLKISRSLRKTLRAGRYRVTLDTRFREVMQACAEPRPGQDGTWITPEMIEAYAALHAQGYAHSVEAWRGEEPVGGLYGVALGAMFFGESMFARAADASKVAFTHLVRQLATWGFTLIDCQVTTAHLARFGAEELPREEFLRRLAHALRAPDRRGAWRFDNDLVVS
jgi:leucyl/phenylalanyl-tRNA--protein transferase